MPKIDTPKTFGTAPDGSTVLRLSIRGGGTTASLLTYGARLQDMRRTDTSHSLVLGALTMDAYLGPMAYYGAIVGPVANRIADARFTLGDHTYDLDANENNKTTLHGGATGFSAQNWTLEAITADSATFILHHSHGRDGFPGNISVKAVYQIDAQGALRIAITGTSDRDTYFSPAFHGYWNLTGGADIFDHTLKIQAQHYLAIDDDSIPTGEPVSVTGSAFDFRSPSSVSGKVDHNFCLDPVAQDAPVCTLIGGNLRLDVLTDQPGLQVYDAGHNDTTPFAGLMGQPYGPVSGIALEPQFWPDTPNQPSYPSNLLRANQTFQQTSVFRITQIS